MGYYSAKNYRVDDSLGFLLNTLSSHLNDEFDALLRAQAGVSLAQWRVLGSLHFNRKDTASALSTLLDYDTGAMTRMLDRLESLGLVVRADDAADRRARKLRLTRRGTSVCKQGFALATENLNRFLEDLTAAECAQLIALLKKVKATSTRMRTRAV